MTTAVLGATRFLLCMLQLTSPNGRQPNLLGSFHHHRNTHWWTIRKGTAPAFSPKNIR